MRTHPSAQTARALWLRMLDREPRRRHLWIRWGFAVLVTVAAMGLRAWIGTPESGARFATLTLAAVLSGLFGGFSAGLLSTVLGMALANYFLVPPFGHAAISDVREALWLNGTFLLTMLVVLCAIWAMQFRNRRLRELTRQLAETEGRFQNTFEHAAAGITHVGLQGQLLETNQTFCDLVGYTREELICMRFQDITVPEDVTIDLALLKEALAGGRSQYTIEKRYRHKHGRLIWAQLTVALMRNASGEPDHFISVVQDISRLKATEEALRTSDQLMQQAQSVAGFVSWEADIARQTFRTLSKNQRWMDLPLTDFGEAEIHARVHPEDRVRMAQEWTLAIHSTTSYLGYYRGHPDNGVAWYLVQANFERDERGQAVRAYGVTQDISTRKLAEIEIQQLNASLERRIQERTQELKSAYGELESYSYAVAHDLRSPLRIINGFAQALEEDNTTLGEHSLTHIQRIKSASQRMGQLIDGLLQLSQYTRGDVQRQSINISTIATRLLTELAQDQPERHVTWSIEPGMQATADPALIEAMFQNLLHNAWKYTSKVDHAQISVYSVLEHGVPCFCVRDNGAGFDMAQANKLFQPFQRLHMPHEFGGLGVGLATARRIAQKHGGDLRAESTPGQGATFYFTLPNERRAAPTANPPG